MQATIKTHPAVIPAQAGIQPIKNALDLKSLNSRLRGNDPFLKLSKKASSAPRVLLTTLLLTLLSTFTLSAHAAVAGRVLVSVGDSVAIRNGQEVRLRFGSPIEDQDTLRTSAAGTLQVRFTDRSIVALREKSTFKLEQYVFVNQAGGKETGSTQKAVFNLIKGGFRTITGLIGKSNQKSYSVRTAAATIGIRGTHYAVRMCESDCKNTDGSNAKDGLYGSVLSASDQDSRIAVENDSGEKEFGRDEHFYVKDTKTGPETLLVPPSFIADNLKGREKSTAQDGGEDTAEGGSNDDPRPNMVSATFDPSVKVADPSCATGDCVTLPPPPLPGLPSTGGPGVVVAYAGLNGATPYAASKSLFILPTLDPSGNLIAYQTILGDSGSGTPTNNVVFDGITIGPAGDGYGNWIGGSVTDSTTTLTPASGVHYLYSAALTLPEVIAAKIGTVNFNHVSGTIPTDHAGNAGIFGGGNLTVDFNANTASMNANWSVVNNTYTLNGTPLNLFVGGGGAGVSALLTNAPTTFCSACSNSTIDQLNIQGNFSGTAGATLGLAISTFDAGIVSTTVTTPVTSASVQVFQEGLPPL